MIKFTEECIVALKAYQNAPASASYANNIACAWADENAMSHAS